MTSPRTIAYLLAEEDPEQIAQVRRSLSRDATSGAEVTLDAVGSFDETLAALAARDEGDGYDALIVDLALAGTEVLDRLPQLCGSWPELAVVVLSDIDDRESAARSLHLGAQDYIERQQAGSELFPRILSHAVERKQVEMKLQRALLESDLQTRKLIQLTRTDALTRLPNRTGFFEQVDQAIERAEAHQRTLAVLYFDLDNFKQINDQYGHAFGDQVLVDIARRLTDNLPPHDILSRLHGDEFALLTHELEDGVQAYSLARQVSRVVAHPLVIDNRTVSVTASVGIATWPECSSAERLVQSADIAMYEAKSNKRHFASFYTPQLARKHRYRQVVEDALAVGIRDQEMYAKFQPIIRPGDPAYLGAEALVRWQSASLGPMRPDQFIPVAETSPLGERICGIVVAECSALWRRAAELGLVIDKLSVNVFASQVSHRDFAANLLAQTAELDLPADALCLEITERQMIDNLDQCQTQLVKLKDAGVKIALDDYGTGFSSVTHLRHLPIDVLKLDRSLVTQLNQDEDNRALIAGIVQMAHRLRMRVVAEGIETVEESALLRDIGCDEFQGYLYGQPMHLADFLMAWRNHGDVRARPRVLPTR